MRNETEDQVQPPQWFLRSMVKKLLPRDIRQGYIELLDEYREPVVRLWHSGAAIWAAYRIQAAAGFNKIAWGLQLAAANFCFSAASLSAGLFLVMLVIVLTLAARDAYTHRSRESAPISPLQHALDPGRDSVIAIASLLLSQALVVKISPTMALPETTLFRGSFVFFPVLSALRMVCRPRFNLSMPIKPKISADDMFRKIWCLNFLWIMACMAIITTNPDSIPDFLPERDFYPSHDFLKTMIPMQLLHFWFRSQMKRLDRYNRIQTLFSYERKKKKLWKKELLMKGLRKNEPFYVTSIILQVLFFMFLAIPLANGLWPWLAGRETDLHVFRLLFNLTTLAIVVGSWNYLKEANRIAGEIIEQDPNMQEKAA